MFKTARLAGSAAFLVNKGASKFSGLLSPSFYLQAVQRVHPQVLLDIVTMYVYETKNATCFHRWDRFVVPYTVLRVNLQAAKYDAQAQVRTKLPEDVRHNQVTTFENGRRVIYELRYRVTEPGLSKN